MRKEPLKANRLKALSVSTVCCCGTILVTVVVCHMTIGIRNNFLSSCDPFEWYTVSNRHPYAKRCVFANHAPGWVNSVRGCRLSDVDLKRMGKCQGKKIQYQPMAP